MAEKFPQFADDEPILQSQPVSSGATGSENLAKTLGNIAEASATKVEKIQADKSNAMYLSSVANIDQLKLSTQELMMNDPSNATKHFETYKDSLDQVLKASYVNNEDRKKLSRYALEQSNSVELESIRENVKQGLIGAEYEHYKNWRFQLNALKTAVRSKDESEVTNLQASMMEQIKALVMSRALTPLQGKAALESMRSAVDLGIEEHEYLANPDKHSASSFQAVMSNPFDPDKSKNIHYPADENTSWTMQYHNSEMSFKDFQDSLFQHRMPDVQAFEKLTPNQRKETLGMMKGIRQADGLIDSNTPLPQINSRIKELEGRNGYAESAERKSLKRYVADVKNGNSQELMARTTLGGQIVRDYNDKRAFLENKLVNTDPKNTAQVGEIQAALARNKNDYVNKSIAYAEAHHWPVVSPIPHEDVATVQNGFSIAGDPGANAVNAYNVIKQYTPRNQMYLADQMKDPRQKVVVQTLAMPGNNSDGDKIDFITANQNRNYKEIDQVTEKNMSDNHLKNYINTQIGGAFNIIQAQNNPATASVLNGQLIQAGVNYAKYLSEKKGMFSLKPDGVLNSVSNVSDVARFINNAYQPMSGANYIVNKNQVDLDESTMSNVAQFAINRGNEYLKQNMSEATFLQLQSQAPLTVTVTPTNILVAKDAFGNIAYREPLNGNVVAAANKQAAEEKAAKTKEEKRLFRQAKELGATSPAIEKAREELNNAEQNKFETKLSAADEKEFKAWKAKNAPNDSGADYDLRGAFKAGLTKDIKSGHWPDTFKKPNHPTFSVESKYAKEAPEKTGHWEGEKYIPPKRKK